MKAPGLKTAAARTLAASGEFVCDLADPMVDAWGYDSIQTRMIHATQLLNKVCDSDKDFSISNVGVAGRSAGAGDYFVVCCVAK